MSENTEDMHRKRAEIVRAYKRCFETDSGVMVLRHLQASFHPSRPRFSNVTEFDAIRAAVCDGQSQVIFHIEEMINRRMMDDDEAAQQPGVTVIKE